MSEIASSDLTIKNHRLTHLTLNSVSSFDSGEIHLGNIDFRTIAIIKKPTNEILTTLKYKAEASAASKKLFDVAVEYEGIFVYGSALDVDSVRGFAKANAPAIIYPLLRSAIAMATLAAGFPPLTLPVINFHKVAVELKEE